MAIRSITISRYPDLPTFSNVLRAAAILILIIIPSLGTVLGVAINHLELAAIHAGFTCRPREPKGGDALRRWYCLAPPVAEGRSRLFLLFHRRACLEPCACVHTDHNGRCARAQELHLHAVSAASGCYRHSRPFCSRMFDSRAAVLSALKGLVLACSGRRGRLLCILAFSNPATSRGCCTT
ncbi:hypothetical protein C8J57DRAFT_1388672, partial [Mycena rebaudengoi]